MKIQTKLFVFVIQAGKKLIDSIINYKIQISIFFLVLPLPILTLFFS